MDPVGKTRGHTVSPTLRVHPMKQDRPIWLWFARGSSPPLRYIQLSSVVTPRQVRGPGFGKLHLFGPRSFVVAVDLGRLTMYMAIVAAPTSAMPLVQLSKSDMTVAVRKEGRVRTSSTDFNYRVPMMRSEARQPVSSKRSAPKHFRSELKASANFYQQPAPIPQTLISYASANENDVYIISDMLIFP
jgi:hypothetical protein